MDARRARTIGALVLAGTVVVVAGCSGGAAASAVAEVSPTTAPTATPPPTPTPAPSPSPSPTPEPTPDLAAIGAAYLALADEFNEVVNPAFAELDAREHTEEEYIALHATIAGAFDAAAVKLDAIEFPADLQDEIDGIRAAWVVIRDAFDKVKEDPTYDAFTVLETKAEEYGALADVVRETLGLPPRPTNPPD